MSNEWPDDDNLLALVRESGEARRAWALIAGLSKTILHERESRLSKKAGLPGGLKHRPARDPRMPRPAPEWWAAKIKQLESRIVGQRKHLAKIEECRAFELESERLLIAALGEILTRRTTGTARALVVEIQAVAGEALRVHEERLGPRPT